MRIKGLTKIYPINKIESVKALDGVSFYLPESGMVFILGKSGSGKSTLLNILGGLDKATSGEIIYKGKDINCYTQSQLNKYRNVECGFIFQEYNVIPELNVFENVAIAAQLQGEKEVTARVEEVLKKVDLDGYGNRKISQLSGGQKQRVAIARALIKQSGIILADEPTGALDSVTGESIFGLLKEISKEKLVIVVSHDRDFAERFADRIIELADGKIVSDSDSAKTEAEESGTMIARTARLPAKAVFKIGTADFRRTPVKLFFTVLICVIAFTLFIISLALSGSDKISITADTIKNGGVNEVKYFKCNESSEYVDFEGGDVEFLENYFGSETIKLFSQDISVKELGGGGSEFLYYAGGLQAVAAIDEGALKDFGFSVEGSLPKSKNEIAITRYTAEVLQYVAGYSVVNGAKLTLNDEVYTVSGVIDTRFNNKRYQSLKTVPADDYLMLGQEFKYYLELSVHTAAYFYETFENGCECVLLPQSAVKTHDMRDIYSLRKGGGQFIFNCHLSWQISEVADMASGLRTPFIVLSAILGVLATGLLVYYIAQSVADKTRTIGILEALGCSGGEILKIFLIEGLLIGIAVFALSLAAGFAACGIINGVCASKLGLAITAVSLGALNSCILFCVTIPLSMLSGALAILRIHRINPIQRISSVN